MSEEPVGGLLGDVARLKDRQDELEALLEEAGWPRERRSIFKDGVTVAETINGQSDGRKEAKVSTEQTNSGPSENNPYKTLPLMSGRQSEAFRAVPAGLELRAEGDGMPTLVGNLAVFDEWTEIRSAREGHFLERMAPGSFSKTVQENSDRMRVLFNHGKDPSVGEKPLGPIRNIEIDEQGVHYEVELLDTTYNRDLLPGLERGLYGSSFRFEVLREDVNSRAKKSTHNPKGLPERTVTELRMSEFGPVTFPAYAGAKSGIRSLTDEFSRAVIIDGKALAEASSNFASIKADLPDEGEQEGDIAPANDRAGESHPVRARRDRTLYDTTNEEPTWHL